MPVNFRLLHQKFKSLLLKSVFLLLSFLSSDLPFDFLFSFLEIFLVAISFSPENKHFSLHFFGSESVVINIPFKSSKRFLNFLLKIHINPLHQEFLIAFISLIKPINMQNRPSHLSPLQFYHFLLNFLSFLFWEWPEHFFWSDFPFVGFFLGFSFFEGLVVLVYFFYEELLEDWLTLLGLMSMTLSIPYWLLMLHHIHTLLKHILLW